MIVIFLNYIKRYNLIITIDDIIVIILIILFSLLMVFFVRKINKIKVSQAVAIVLFTIVFLTILTLTVIGRIPGERQLQIIPFWSYGEILCGNHYVLKQVILNIVLFVPIGILLPFLLNKKVSLEIALVYGVVFSSIIEVLQLVTCRGLCEFDDIFHNSLGCMIGCMIHKKITECRNSTINE